MSDTQLIYVWMNNNSKKTHEHLLVDFSDIKLSFSFENKLRKFWGVISKDWRVEKDVLWYPVFEGFLL